MRIKVVRKIGRDKVRNLCIRRNFYTRGTNEDYENLLYVLLPKETVTLTDELLVAVVDDIFKHSEVYGEDGLMERFGYDIEEGVAALIANLILNECTTDLVTEIEM